MTGKHGKFDTLRGGLLTIIARVVFGLRAFDLLLRVCDIIGSRRRTTRHGPSVSRKQAYRYQVLTYHRVNDQSDPFFPGVPTRTFERQMQILREHYSVFSLEELVLRSLAKEVPPRAVAITFDDGYMDNYTNAYPILREYDLHATIFVVTGVVDGQIGLWHDQLFDAFRRTSVTELTFADKRFAMKTLDDRVSTLHEILPDLRQCCDERRQALVRSLLSHLAVEPAADESQRTLSWREIVEMNEHGISIGAHTVSHPILSKTSQMQAEREVVDSKRTIESKLGRAVTLFAYPNGGPSDFDAVSKRIVREAGFHCAVTTIWGSNGEDNDVFELRRVGLWGDDAQNAWIRLAIDRSL